MKKAELQLENQELKLKLEVLNNKNKILNELALFYADPLNEWDAGAKAKKVIKILSRGYKPVNGDLAVMFKEKETYPFIEFGNYIDDREENEDGY